MDDQSRIALIETKTVSDDALVSTPIPVVRYQLSNHLGSASLELSDAGDVISYEEYHPYGTTAYHAGKSVVQENPKRYRYTGKERDAETGFSYHGARYLALWLGRWLSADPVGLFDGMNRYLYAKNNPLINVDSTGMFNEQTDRKKIKSRQQFLAAMQKWEPLVDAQFPGLTLEEKLQLFADDFNAPTSDQKLQVFGSYHNQFGKYTGVGVPGRSNQFPLDFEHFIKNSTLTYSDELSSNYSNYYADVSLAAKRLLRTPKLYGAFALGIIEEGYQAVSVFATDAAKTSAFSPEDVVSNYFGLLYGYRLSEQPEGTTLTDYTERFFNDLDNAFQGQPLDSNSLISSYDVRIIEHWLGTSLPQFASDLPQNAKNNKTHVSRVKRIRESLETDSLIGWWAGIGLKFVYGTKDLVTGAGAPAEFIEGYHEHMELQGIHSREVFDWISQQLPK
jgi:RHS repeat-associated protein